ncbi:MAG: DUF1294 domain-containing protein [Lachnospiraceae bacterium]|nr:DUF1294 domain-containing protein [Lachnospiraceae bacterium]
MEYIFLVVYFVVNLIVFVMYGIDKFKAKNKMWRIPEATLLGGAVLGVFGALAGMYLFRHKTKKPKFFITVPAIAIIEIGLFIWFCGM